MRSCEKSEARVLARGFAPASRDSSIAAAIAPGAATGTCRPHCPFSRISDDPPASVLTIGVPTASACISAFGQPSVSEELTKTFACLIQAKGFGTKPPIRTSSATPAWLAMAARRPRSGPSPRITSRHGRCERTIAECAHERGKILERRETPDSEDYRRHALANPAVRERFAACGLDAGEIERVVDHAYLVDGESEDAREIPCDGMRVCDDRVREPVCHLDESQQYSPTHRTDPAVYLRRHRAHGNDAARRAAGQAPRKDCDDIRMVKCREHRRGPLGTQVSDQWWKCAQDAPGAEIDDMHVGRDIAQIGPLP